MLYSSYFSIAENMVFLWNINLNFINLLIPLVFSVTSTFNSICIVSATKANAEPEWTYNISEKQDFLCSLLWKRAEDKTLLVHKNKTTIVASEDFIKVKSTKKLQLRGMPKDLNNNIAYFRLKCCIDLFKIREKNWTYILQYSDSRRDNKHKTN